jgi:hypothetical protein
MPSKYLASCLWNDFVSYVDKLDFRFNSNMVFFEKTTHSPYEHIESRHIYPEWIKNHELNWVVTSNLGIGSSRYQYWEKSVLLTLSIIQYALGVKNNMGQMKTTGMRKYEIIQIVEGGWLLNAN